MTIILSSNIYAHSGGTNSEGCHNNTKTGGYHCHGSKTNTYTQEPNINKSNNLSEDELNDKFCAEVGGKREVLHTYKTIRNESGYIFVDCETEDYVYEGGIDKRSSLDSIQQAVFSSVLTGKKAGVVIYDINSSDKYEYRIGRAANQLGIKFILYNP